MQFWFDKSVSLPQPCVRLPIETSAMALYWHLQNRVDCSILRFTLRNFISGGVLTILLELVSIKMSCWESILVEHFTFREQFFEELFFRTNYSLITFKWQTQGLCFAQIYSTDQALLVMNAIRGLKSFFRKNNLRVHFVRTFFRGTELFAKSV